VIAMSDATADRSAQDHRVEELQSEVISLRRDLLSVRDALIGAQAEAATLKVENRELQVRVGQLTQTLAEQTTFNRMVGRIRRDPRVRAAGRRARALLDRRA
jgi:hypothetical protein